MKDRYYFAYGSNMNLEQMKYRCPAAEVVENVRLENYRLAFRGRAPGNGVATVLPEKGSYVEGVLWKITEACEKSLDFYEGFPSFYGKESPVTSVSCSPFFVRSRLPTCSSFFCSTSTIAAPVSGSI